jgi:cell division protein DivIC
MMKLTNKVLRFRSPERETEVTDVPKELPPKLHPRVKRRRMLWLVSMIVFFGWCVTQLVIQEVRISAHEELLQERKRELAKTKEEQQQLIKELKQFEDKDYMMEQAHKHGYGKIGEKNVSVTDE